MILRVQGKSIFDYVHPEDKLHASLLQVHVSPCRAYKRLVIGWPRLQAPQALTTGHTRFGNFVMPPVMGTATTAVKRAMRAIKRMVCYRMLMDRVREVIGRALRRTGMLISADARVCLYIYHTQPQCKEHLFRGEVSGMHESCMTV